MEATGSIHEFVLLVHWQEQVKEEDDSWGACNTNHLLKVNDTEIGDIVLAVLVLRNPNSTRERVALVPVPYDSWAAASPEDKIIELI
jgi:hypothetical protein